MKTWHKRTLAGTTAALILGGAILGAAYASPDEDDHYEYYGPGMMMGAPMGRGPAVMLQKLDLDGDGRVTREEALRARSQELEKYDTDGDGQLTVQEYERLWLDYARPMMVRRFQMHDTDADGRITKEEYGAKVDRMFWRLDRNGDGVIDPAEVRRMTKMRPKSGRYWDDD